jgi:hypothetical protein
MKMKKSVVGLLSAFLVVGASASAFAASEETGNALVSPLSFPVGKRAVFSCHA